MLCIKKQWFAIGKFDKFLNRYFDKYEKQWLDIVKYLTKLGILMYFVSSIFEIATCLGFDTFSLKSLSSKLLNMGFDQFAIAKLLLGSLSKD